MCHLNVTAHHRSVTACEREQCSGFGGKRGREDHTPPQPCALEAKVREGNNVLLTRNLGKRLLVGLGRCSNCRKSLTNRQKGSQAECWSTQKQPFTGRSHLATNTTGSQRRHLALLTTKAVSERQWSDGFVTPRQGPASAGGGGGGAMAKNIVGKNIPMGSPKGSGKAGGE